MILSKDLQEILEGVHYFLAEALARESLSGRAECLRRGLVLQLEALTGAYPTLRIQPSQPGGGAGGVPKNASSASLPYLPMETPRSTGPTTTSTYHSSSSSSGVNSNSNSSNNSSSGGSGDGQVVGGRRGGPGAPLTEEESEGGYVEEVYEEFEDCKDEGVELTKLQKGGGGGGDEGEEKEEKEEEDGVYTETHDPVSFSSLIATCERHGALGKKTKGLLLRNIKSYLCVAAGGMLYLYLKDTDDRQKKSIDLTGYTARPATGEDIKEAKKRDAAFEIVCPGRKTHTFIARTAKDKQDWLDALSRTIRAGKTKPPPALSQAPVGLPQAITVPATPPKPTSVPVQPPVNPTKAAPYEDEYTLYNDVMEEELYEEIQGDQVGGSLDLPPPPSSMLFPTPSQPHQHSTTTSTPSTTTTECTDYDPVEADTPAPNPPSTGPAPPRPQPPARPPLPQHLQDRQADRQAGQQTEDNGADSDDSQGIYCEIEDDLLESARLAYSDNLKDSPDVDKGPGPKTISNAPIGPYKPNFAIGGLGGVGSFGNEVFKSLGDSGQKLPGSLVTSGPPKLPAKGLPPPPQREESEYKVPQSAADGEYQVPSSTPVPTEAGKDVAGGGVGKISGPIKNPTSILQVPQTQTILPIKPLERRASMAEDKKSGVSSFRSGDGDTTRPLRPTTGTSVRDMIARLNQRKDDTEETDTKVEEEKEEEKVTPTSSSLSLSLPRQHLQPDKPPLPARPSNLRGTSPLPPPPSQGNVEEGKEQEKEIEEEKELYDVLDNDDDSSPLQQQGEWYVAKFAFVATLGQALSFGRGDEVFVYDTSGASGWWRATLRGRSGLVPREYLRKKE